MSKTRNKLKSIFNKIKIYIADKTYRTKPCRFCIHSSEVQGCLGKTWCCDLIGEIHNAGGCWCFKDELEEY
jgi:hypothetical protein